MALLQTTAVGQRAAELSGRALPQSFERYWARRPAPWRATTCSCSMSPGPRRPKPCEGRTPWQQRSSSFGPRGFKQQTAGCRQGTGQADQFVAAADKPVERHHQRAGFLVAERASSPPLSGEQSSDTSELATLEQSVQQNQLAEHRGHHWEPGRHARYSGSGLDRQALRARRSCRPHRRPGDRRRLCRRAGGCFGPAPAPGRGGFVARCAGRAEPEAGAPSEEASRAVDQAVGSRTARRGQCARRLPASARGTPRKAERRCSWSPWTT